MKKHVRERQEFIKNQIDTKGEINRKDLMNEFEVSGATAAVDFRFFRENNPDYLEYCNREKKYKKAFTDV